MGVEEHRTGDVPGVVQLAAGRPGERPADGGDAERGGVEMGPEPVDADDRTWQAQHAAMVAATVQREALALGDGAADPLGAGVGDGGASPGRAPTIARFTASSTPISRNTTSPLDQV